MLFSNNGNALFNNFILVYKCEFVVSCNLGACAENFGKLFGKH